jgi:hypothetical protein
LTPERYSRTLPFHIAEHDMRQGESARNAHEPESKPAVANPPATQPRDRGHIAQQELLESGLKERSVADALEDFDGDES